MNNVPDSSSGLDSIDLEDWGNWDDDDSMPSDPTGLRFPTLTVEHLKSAAASYGVRCPLPTDVTPDLIAKTRLKTQEAGLCKLLTSHLQKIFNRAMNRLLISMPETERMSDLDVRDLPGFPDADHIVEVVTEYLMENGITESVRYEFEDGRPTIDVQGHLSVDGRSRVAGLIGARGLDRWSPTAAWGFHRRAVAGGEKSRRRTTGVIEALLAWEGPLPTVEAVMEQFDKSRSTAYAYLAEAKRLRNEP